MSSDYPENFRYTSEHEWVLPDGNRWRVGITRFAVTQLGEVVFVELPKVGASFSKGDSFGTIESVKAVSEMYAPVTGKIAAVNEALVTEPEKINNDPNGEGWIIEIEPSTTSELEGLMDAAQYEVFLAQEAAK
jgi:glycine cleavage system H protein